jgi:type I site-specific restriction-modification system R (restriction) subunit
VNPAGGHRTAYLWEKVWARESWLEILGRYLVIVRDKKKQITEYVFPRFHQLDVTRKLVAAVLHDGPGGKYLVHRLDRALSRGVARRPEPQGLRHRGRGVGSHGD